MWNSSCFAAAVMSFDFSALRNFADIIMHTSLCKARNKDIRLSRINIKNFFEFRSNLLFLFICI